jgi:class 3 adenylate cyclase
MRRKPMTAFEVRAEMGATPADGCRWTQSSHATNHLTFDNVRRAARSTSELGPLWPLRKLRPEAPLRIERRLSAILAADVAGYSRLMHNDEEATHARLTMLLSDAVEPSISQHGGRVEKTPGIGSWQNSEVRPRRERCDVRRVFKLKGRFAGPPERLADPY